MDKLKELRGEKSQMQIAKAIGITREAYASYESSRRQANYEVLIKLANYFNVSIDYLLNRNSDKKKEAPTMLELRKDEEYLLSHYNELTQDQKEMILQSVTLFCNSNHNNRQNSDIRDLFV